MNHFTRIVAAALVFCVSEARSITAETSSPEVIRYQENALTVRVRAMPSTALLQAIERETGAKIASDALTPHPIDADFGGVPLGKALERLFPGASTFIRFGPDGRVREIRFLTEGPAPSEPPLPATVAPDQENAPATASVPTDDDEWSEAQEDGRSPVQQALEAIRQSSDLRHIAFTQLRRLGPQKMMEALHEQLGDDSHALVQQIAEDSSMGMLGRAAARVLRKMETCEGMPDCR